MARSARTVSSRISGWPRTGLIQRAVAASPWMVSQREASQRPQAHLLHERPEQRRRELAGQHQRLAGQARRAIVEGVAGDEHDPPQREGAVAHDQ
jgi:hypothetical protein